MYVERIEWPNNKKCVVMVSINLTAELFWLALDPTCIDKPKTLSMGEYGMNIGLDRVLNVLDNYKIKGTFFVPGKIAEVYTEKIMKVKEKGHEIALKGYSNENYGILSEKEQEIEMMKGIQALEENCKIIPRGFRAPEGELTKFTLKLARSLGIEYSSNLSDDDRPYWIYFEHKNPPILEIPNHWAMYDLPYFAFNYRPAFPSGQGRIAHYKGVLNNWKKEFYGHYNYGLCYVLQIDPQTIGNPGRIRMLENLLDYINDFEEVWFATGSDILDYFKKNKTL